MDINMYFLESQGFLVWPLTVIWFWSDKRLFYEAVSEMNF